MDGVTGMFAPLHRLPPSLLLHTHHRHKQIPHLFLKIITVKLILIDSRRTLGLFQWTSTYHTITAKYQGNYRVRPFILACARARTRRSLGSYTSVVCLHSLSSLALLFLSVALFYLDFRNHFWSSSLHVLDAIFFSHKRNTLPLGNRFPHTNTHVPHQKYGYSKPSWNSCCTTRHTLPIVVAIFWTILSSLSLFFFLARFLSPFFHDFLTTRKENLPQSISSLQFQGVCSSPPNCYLIAWLICSQSPFSYDTRLSAHSYIS